MRLSFVDYFMFGGSILRRHRGPQRFAKAKGHFDGSMEVWKLGSEVG